MFKITEGENFNPFEDWDTVRNSQTIYDNLTDALLAYTAVLQSNNSDSFPLTLSVDSWTRDDVDIVMIEIPSRGSSVSMINDLGSIMIKRP